MCNHWLRNQVTSWHRCDQPCNISIGASSSLMNCCIRSMVTSVTILLVRRGFNGRQLLLFTDSREHISASRSRFEGAKYAQSYSKTPENKWTKGVKASVSSLIKVLDHIPNNEFPSTMVSDALTEKSRNIAYFYHGNDMRVVCK